jgi:Sigma-70 factor, region 1.2
MASPKGAAIAKDGDGLRLYLQQIQKLPMLGAQEELELSRSWRKDQMTTPPSSSSLAIFAWLPR